MQYKHNYSTPADRRIQSAMGDPSDRRNRIRHTQADRVYLPVIRHTPPPPSSEPGGFMFIVIGASLAVCVLALAIALLSQ